MEKIQEKRSRRFIIGIILIIGSSAYGWIAVFLFPALALKYGKFWAVFGTIIYGLSWITFGLGFLLAGREGVTYSKRIFKRIFKCGK